MREYTESEPAQSSRILGATWKHLSYWTHFIILLLHRSKRVSSLKSYKKRLGHGQWRSPRLVYYNSSHHYFRQHQAPDETDRPHFSLRTKQRGADEFLRKQRQRLRLSDFFRPTWEDLVGLRVISVNLISLGLMHKSFTCWFIYSEMACEDNL